MKLTVDIKQKILERPPIILAYSKGSAIDIIPMRKQPINQHARENGADNDRKLCRTESRLIIQANSRLQSEVRILKDKIATLKYEKSMLVKWVEFLF